MDVIKKEKKECECHHHCRGGGAGGGAVYGIGLIGALVYYIQHATNFTDGLMGVLKAFAWPAMMVYRLLEVFKF